MSHTVPASAVRRFHDKVGPVCNERGCREWQGTRINGDYGQIQLEGRGPTAVREYAHRTAWRIHNDADIPDGMKVLHECDNRPCVEGSHLFLGTSKDNTQDMVAKGRWRGRGPRRLDKGVSL